MRENSKNIKPLNHLLPQHKVDERLWDKIESRMDESSSVFDDLPVYSAKASLWEPISRSLSMVQQKQRRLRIVRYSSGVAAVAASVLLVVLFNVLQNPNEKATASVVVFTEEVVESAPAISHIQTQTQANVMGYCSQFPDICTTPEFADLKIKWEKLKGELKRLKSLSNGDDNDRLQLYITRIESDIQQLENRMMHMFM